MFVGVRPAAGPPTTTEWPCPVQRRGLTPGAPADASGTPSTFLLPSWSGESSIFSRGLLTLPPPSRRTYRHLMPLSRQQATPGPFPPGHIGLPFACGFTCAPRTRATLSQLPSVQRVPLLLPARLSPTFRDEGSRSGDLTLRVPGRQPDRGAALTWWKPRWSAMVAEA